MMFLTAFFTSLFPALLRPGLPVRAPVHALRAFAALCLTLSLTPAAALPGVALSEEEIQYPMEAGDTLIGLAGRALTDPQAWPQVQKLNGVADPYRIPVGTVLRIPVRLLDPQPLEARIEDVTGQATLDGVAAQTGMAVRAGAQLSTGEQGRVSLRLPDESLIVVPARSTLQVASLRRFRGLSGLDVQMQLTRGRVESQVNPRRGPSARYRIETPTAVIGVRGTTFRTALEARSGDSTAEVLAGTVAVAQVSSGASLAVKEGFGVRVGEGETPVARPLLGAPPVEGLPVLFETPVFRIPLPAMEGATAWRAQIAPADGTPIRLDLETREAAISVSDLADGDYLLYLRAVDELGIEGRDATHAFRLKARPEPPFPSRPEEKARLTEGTVSFVWSEPVGMTHYRLQVATNPGFDTLLVDTQQDTPRFETALTPGEYYWRLASIRGEADQGPWSAVSRFVVRPQAKLAAAPEFADGLLRFRWAAQPGQQAEYQLASDPAFRSLDAQGRTVDESIELPSPPAGEYWLRLRIIDADGFTGPWSEPQKFSVPLDPNWWLPFALPLVLILL